jgi:hypothetical protein
MANAAIYCSKKLWARVDSFRQRFGVAGALYKTLDIVLHKALRTHVHRVVWLELKSVVSMVPPDASFGYRFLTADELAVFAQEPSYFIGPSLVADVRNGRTLCFAALFGERLAAFGCYTLRHVEPDQAAGAALSFPSDVAYMSYGFTHPDFRGFRLHGLIMGLALQELAKRGVTKLVSLVAWTNWASLKSCERLGYVNLGKMITIGGKQGAWGIYPKAAKQLGVRFGRCAAKMDCQVGPLGPCAIATN